MPLDFTVAYYADCGSFRMQVVRRIGRGHIAQIRRDSEIVVSRQYRSLAEAQEWLLFEAQARGEACADGVVWRKVSVPLDQVAAVFTVWVIVLYAVPTFLEFVALQMEGRLSYLLVGDLLAYLVIFFLGHKRLAVAAYLTARLAEVGLVRSNVLSLDEMLWVSDVIPSLLAAALLCQRVIFLPANPVDWGKVRALSNRGRPSKRDAA